MYIPLIVIIYLVQLKYVIIEYTIYVEVNAKPIPPSVASVTMKEC